MPIQNPVSFELEKTSVKSRFIPARVSRTLSCPPKMPRKSSEKDQRHRSEEDDDTEDRHVVEVLRRLEDLGVDLPSKSMAPDALRNHKRDPLGFVAIASQLATIIEPLIEMTGADNPTLARRSCETIRTLGPGTSEEDRASRALGALAVLAVGQMMMIAFGETSRRRRRPFFFAT